MLDYIPEHIQKRGFEEFGETPEGAAQAIWLYNKEIVDAVADLIPAVKPQIAMYEQFGIPGLEAYESTVDYCRDKGLIVIGDVKRGDIGSTSEAYARGHLAGKAFDVDFATVNPYLGSDGVMPFVKICKEHDKGIFVLVKTSNPSSGEFQDVLIGDGRAVYELVGQKVREWGADCMEGAYSNVGAVVGATYPEQARILRKLMPHTFILAPGYGAQGATAKDLSAFFDEEGEGAIVNSSRGIIAAHTKDAYRDFGPEGFAQAARAASIDMIEDLRSAIADR
jgi:orotidine-5'-phosphate decarboxylase